MNFLRHNGGYSITEVVVASAVFLICALAISGMLMQGYRAMGLAGKRSLNLHAAQEEMEVAIADDSYYSPDAEVSISREDDYIEVFGVSVAGTRITVIRTIPGQSDGEITYTYFAPGYGGD